MNSSTSSFKIFLLGWLISFLLAVGVFLLGSEWIVRKKVIPVDNFHAFSRLIATGDYPAIILGDSRMCTGLVASKSMGNLAYPGMTIEDIAYAWSRYHDHTSPRLVLLQANPYLLRYNSQQQRDEGGKPLEQMYAPGRILKSTAPTYRPRLLDYWKRIALRKPFEKFRPVQENGGQLWERTLDPESKNFGEYLGETLDIALPITGCSQSEDAENYKTLVRRLKESGVKVIMVSPPVSPFFREQAKSEPAFQEAVAFFQTVSKEFGIPLIDLSRQIDNPEMFNDNVHLNRAGAEVFTKRLMEEVESLKSKFF